MDPRISAIVDANTPKLNMVLARGLAYEQMKYAVQYVENLWREVAKGFPPGLKFLGGERCTPQEQVNEESRKGGNKPQIDVAQSDVFLMRYKFTYNGKAIDRFMYLPFVRPGGVIFLNGSRFVISPVMSDKVISVGQDFVFVKLGKARPTFKRIHRSWMANGRMETCDVVWSKLHHKPAKNINDKPTVRAETTLVHYLFCKYGFTEAFQKFTGCVPIAGRADEINQRNYPVDEYTICSSAALRLNVPIKLAVRNEDYKNQMTKNFIAAFFYVIEQFVSWRSVDHTYLDSKRWWCVLLGHMLPGSTEASDSKLADEMSDHIYSLDAYLDEIIRKEFRDIGLEVNDIYELFQIIIQRFSHWVLTSDAKINSMYDKELSILYYVLNDITNAINTLYFRLHTSSSKKELTERDILSLMKKTIKPGLIFSIKKAAHGEVSTVSASGDNMAYKTTSLLVPQTGSNKTAGKKENVSLEDPAFGLHVSVAEYGGYTHIPKSEPSGRSRINHFAHMLPNGTLVRNPDLKEDLDKIQARLDLKGDRAGRIMEIDPDSLCEAEPDFEEGMEE